MGSPFKQRCLTTRKRFDEMDDALRTILHEVQALRQDTARCLDKSDDLLRHAPHAVPHRIEEALLRAQGSASDVGRLDSESTLVGGPAPTILTREDLFVDGSAASGSDGWADNPLYNEQSTTAVVKLPKQLSLRDDAHRISFDPDLGQNKTSGTDDWGGVTNEELSAAAPSGEKPAVSASLRGKDGAQTNTLFKTLSERYGSAKRHRDVNAARPRTPLCSVALHTISPETKSVWDLFISVVMVWVCIMSPYMVCFGDPDKLPAAFHFIEFGVDIVFAADILLTLNTRYIDEEGRLVRQRWRIFKRYSKSWLLLDLVAVVPWHVLQSYSSNSSFLPIAKMVKILKVLRLLRTTRLLRVNRVQVMLRMFERVVGSVYWKVGRFMVIVALMSHWCACVFHYVAYLEEDTDKLTWVKAGHYEDCGYRFRYLTSLYWSLATMTSVGYGDVVAVTEAERAVSVFAMLVGVTIFAYIMGAVNSLISALNSTSARIAAKRQRVDDFLRARMVPTFLSNKVREFYSYIVMKEFANDDSEIIGGLPSKLRTQIILFLFRDTLAKILYFENKAPQFIAELVMMMKIEFYSPGDFIVIQGEMSTEMYVVVEGRLSIRAYENITKLHEQLYCGNPVEAAYKLLGHIEMGSQFGEYACLTNEPRTATVVAETYCELYSLSREGLNAVMDRWPQYRNEISKTILEKSKARAPTPPASESGGATVTRIAPSTNVPMPGATSARPSVRMSLAMRTSTFEIPTFPTVARTHTRSVISIPRELQPYLHTPFSSQDDEIRSLLRHSPREFQ